MIENIRQFFKNQSKEGKECQKVLGNTKKLGEFAKFWENNGNDIAVVVAGKLIDFSTSREYTEKEFAAYKEGLQEVGIFLGLCWTEYEMLKQDSKE